MDDLLDLSWQDKAPGQLQAKQSVPARQNNPFSALPASIGSTTPVTRSQTPVQQSKAAADSFGGLVSFGTRANGQADVSLAARAQALQAEREAEAMRQSQLFDAHFGATQAKTVQVINNPFKAAPTLPVLAQLQQTEPDLSLRRTNTETTEELLASINGERPEPKRSDSYFPPPDSPSRPSSAMMISKQPMPAPSSISLAMDQQDDDDAFGVFAAAKNKGKAKQVVEVDDILGDLGRPVTDTALKTQAPQPLNDSSDEDEDLRRAKEESLASAREYEHRARTGEPDWGVSAQDPRLPYIKQIVEMGFTPAQARVALANTETGLDVAAAMELLLQLQGQPINAPQRSRQQTQQNQGRPGQTQNANGAWVDTTYELATKTFATANSWLTNKSAMARRKLAEYNASAAQSADLDDRPRWMRDADRFERKEKGKSKARWEDEEAEAREQGLPLHPAERKRLEANGVLSPSANTTASSRRGSVDSNRSGKSFAGSIKSMTQSVASTLVGVPLPSSQPQQHQQHQQQQIAMDSRRFKADDDETPVYVSSRRRRPPPAVVEEDLFGALGGSGSGSGSGSTSNGKGKATRPNGADLLNSGSASASSKFKAKGKAPALEEVDLFSPPKQPTRPSQPARAAASSLSQPSATRRDMPYLDASVLATMLQNKTRGSDAFKRGDFGKALGYYDAALQPLPKGHPSRISILSNRSLAYIQTGSPKLAIQDCDEALAILGPGEGRGETIDEANTAISLSGLWAKVMQRKATALEMQERHTEALAVWQALVRSGQGGATAMQAKQRCEKLCAPKPEASVKKAQPAAVNVPPSGQGVDKLRAEAAVQEKNELQRQALLDEVGDKITAWSKGKEGNLRALLASLDTILWPAANWKKVSLADLVLDGKVKVIYMKALAKVHPDKIPRDASVEQQMIAGAVFAKLNGAWDAFKKQAGQ